MLVEYIDKHNQYNFQQNKLIHISIANRRLPDGSFWAYRFIFFLYYILFLKKKRYGNHSAYIFHLFLFSASSAHFSSLVCEQDDCQNLVNIEIRLSQFTQLVVNQSPLATQLSYTYALGKRATFSNLAYWLYQLYEFI